MNIEEIRKEFPFFANSKGSCIYFDNAATTQRARCVLEEERRFSCTANANPLRGLYDLSIKATRAYENGREKVAKFIGAPSSKEVIFTRNTTEAMNLIAMSFGMANVKEGDEIAISIMEHHSNMLPWVKVARDKGAKVVWLLCDKETGQLSLDEVKKKITKRTKLVAITQVSNVLGMINDIPSIARIAHEAGAYIVVDGAQSVPHIKVDVKALGADFLSFSAHKMTGPFGVGVLWGKEELLEAMPPFLQGGEMIESVHYNGEGLDIAYAPLPEKFEAGTVNAAGVVGLASAVDYITSLDIDCIARREAKIVSALIEGMRQVPHLNIVGSHVGCGRCGIVSFTLDGCHPHDIASVLDSEGIAIRAGYHCAQPLAEYMGVGPTARASVYFYNTLEEVDIFLQKIMQVRKWLGLK